MLFAWFKQLRRKRLVRQPFPAEWLLHLTARFPPYASLTVGETRRLKADMQVFIAEKNWEGCGDLTVTDEMRVAVAAWACLLVLELDHDFYSRVKSILIYPTSYFGPEVGRHGMVGPPALRMGEAWYRGPVVLSWGDVKRGSRRGSRSNVVLHEFAHQLDMLDRVVDGTPPLVDRQEYATWAKVMNDEYHHLRDNSRQGLPTLLDPYGATDEGEFFAVATETFFLASTELAHEHPRLYELLRSYFRQDPAERVTRHSAE